MPVCGRAVLLAERAGMHAVPTPSSIIHVLLLHVPVSLLSRWRSWAPHASGALWRAFRHRRWRRGFGLTAWSSAIRSAIHARSGSCGGASPAHTLPSILLDVASVRAVLATSLPMDRQTQTFKTTIALRQFWRFTLQVFFSHLHLDRHNKSRWFTLRAYGLALGVYGAAACRAKPDASLPAASPT